MKRFHVNVSVSDVGRSIEFYRTLFGTEPTLVREDYAKWMLEDPRLNFAISRCGDARGISHVGLQADSLEELGEIQERLRAAEATTVDQENAECCYARSTKTWVNDPDRVAWETFVTHGQTTRYGNDLAPTESAPAKAGACC